MREDIYNGREIEWLSEDKKELEIFFLTKIKASNISIQ